MKYQMMESLVILKLAQERSETTFQKVPGGPEIGTFANFKGMTESELSGGSGGSEESEESDKSQTSQKSEKSTGGTGQNAPGGSPQDDQDPNQYPYPYLDPELRMLICECRAANPAHIPDLIDLFNRVNDAVTNRNALWYINRPGGMLRESDQSIREMIHTILHVPADPGIPASSFPVTQPTRAMQGGRSA